MDTEAPVHLGAQSQVAVRQPSTVTRGEQHPCCTELVGGRGAREMPSSVPDPRKEKRAGGSQVGKRGAQVLTRRAPRGNFSLMFCYRKLGILIDQKAKCNGPTDSQWSDSETGLMPCALASRSPCQLFSLPGHRRSWGLIHSFILLAHSFTHSLTLSHSFTPTSICSLTHSACTC